MVPARTLIVTKYVKVIPGFAYAGPGKFYI